MCFEGCNNGYSQSLILPLPYLWDENWPEEEEKRKIEEAKKQEELAELKRLKEKYEGVQC